MKYLLYILAIFSIITACTSVNCSEKVYVTCNYDMLKADGSADTIRYYLTVSTKRANDGCDTVFVNKQLNTMKINLPMNYDALRSDTLYFTLKDTASTPRFDLCDTVIVNKETYPYFEDVNCKARFEHNITSIEHTTHFIDSLTIKESFVSNDSKTNIYLYIHSYK